MPNKKSYSIIFIIFFQFIISSLYGGTTGKIAGVLTDAETGEGLLGANVYLEGTSLGAATDLNGDFVILNIPPGSYIIVASMIGYQDQRILDLKVSIDFTTKLELKLNTTLMEDRKSVV